MVARSTLAPVLPEEVLSRRQLEALRLYAEIGNQQEVAHRMGIAYKSCRDLLSTAYRELDCLSAIEAFRVLGWLVVPE